MRRFDTLIRADTLTRLETPGPNRRISIREGRIRHEEPFTKPGENKHLI